eukprot:9276416-Lingulodinium_polyedra.AAC.1
MQHVGIQLDLSHPLVADEDEWASVAAQLALSLVDARFKSLAWHSYAFPGNMAALLHPEEAVVQQCLAHMKHSWAAFLVAKTKTTRLVQRLVHRSLLNTAVVEEIFEKLAETGFSSVPPDVHQRLVQTFSTMGTKVVEDAFHVERRMETGGQDNKVVSSARKWLQPIAAKLLSSSHHFPEIS